MNFAMSEFGWRRGYLSPWTLMVELLVGIAWWFRRRGWR
jgi:Mg2+ and Co2+ transporter CorA